MTGAGTTNFNGASTIGTVTLAGGRTLGGSGATTFGSGTLTVSTGGATISGSNFTISGGTVVTTGTLTLSGTSSWTQASIYGGGGLNVTGTLTLLGTSNAFLGGAGNAGRRRALVPTRANMIAPPSDARITSAIALSDG